MFVISPFCMFSPSPNANLLLEHGARPPFVFVYVSKLNLLCKDVRCVTILLDFIRAEKTREKLSVKIARKMRLKKLEDDEVGGGKRKRNEEEEDDDSEEWIRMARQLLNQQL